MEGKLAEISVWEEALIELVVGKLELIRRLEGRVLMKLLSWRLEIEILVI